MKKKVRFPIDFVITWVNQDDLEWKKKYKMYSSEDSDTESSIRYRDYGTLRYVFRSINQYAPWVHRVFLVTDHQVPSWLNLDCEKLIVVNHEDYINKKYLPTFNSNVLELNLFKINELSEHFVNFNDDMFINRPVRPEQFFDPNGDPKDTLGTNVIMPTGRFDHTYVNNLSIINAMFSKKKVLKNNFFKIFNIKNYEWNLFSFLLLPWPKFTRFFDPHIPLSIKKSQMETIIKKYPEILNTTNKNKFRATTDFSIWVVRYAQMLEGTFSVRSAHFGKRYALNEYSKINSDIASSKHALICINDADNMSALEFKTAINSLKDQFEKSLSYKSQFEI